MKTKRIFLKIAILFLAAPLFAKSPKTYTADFNTAFINYIENPSEESWADFIIEMEKLENSVNFSATKDAYPDFHKKFQELKDKALGCNFENGNAVSAEMAEFFQEQVLANSKAENLLGIGLYIVIGAIVSFVFIFVVYIQKEITEKNALLLAKAAIDAQEEERSRLSFELHDTVAQNLRSLSLKYDKDLITETIKEVRSICYDLTPPSIQNKSLVEALNVLCADFSEKTKIDCSSIFTDEKTNTILNSLSVEKQLYIFRIVQEALTNIEKHAGRPVSCSVSGRTVDNSACIFITDNGIGFEMKKTFSSQSSKEKKFGIMSMTERAKFIGSRLTIQSELDSGTTVKLVI